MLDSSFQCVFYTNSSFRFPSLSCQQWNEVLGIENLCLSQTFNYSDPLILGGVIGPSQINSPIQTYLSIDKYYVDTEIFALNLFSEPSCFYIYNGCNFHVLTNAYLTDYSVSINVGDIPKITSKFSSYEFCINTQSTFPVDRSSAVYGMVEYQYVPMPPVFGPIYKPPLTVNQKYKPFTSGTDIVKLNSIFLSGSDANSIANAQKIEYNQNIYSFDYSLSYNRQALFSVGDVFPIVKTVPPIKVNLSISSKIMKEELHKFEISMQDNLCFSVVVSGNNITNYCISGAKLTSQDVQISCCNIMDYKRNYIGYLL